MCTEIEWVEGENVMYNTSKYRLKPKMSRLEKLHILTSNSILTVAKMLHVETSHARAYLKAMKFEAFI